MLDFGLVRAIRAQVLALLPLAVAPEVLAAQEQAPVLPARVITPSIAYDATSSIDVVGSYRTTWTEGSGMRACHLVTGVCSAPPLSRGRKIALSAVAGFGVGAVIGGTIMYRRTRDCDGPCVFNTYAVVGASLGGGLAGAIVGGSLGALVFRNPKARNDQ